MRSFVRVQYYKVDSIVFLCMDRVLEGVTVMLIKRID